MPALDSCGIALIAVLLRLWRSAAAFEARRRPRTRLPLCGKQIWANGEQQQLDVSLRVHLRLHSTCSKRIEPAGARSALEPLGASSRAPSSGQSYMPRQRHPLLVSAACHVDLPCPILRAPYRCIVSSAAVAARSSRSTAVAFVCSVGLRVRMRPEPCSMSSVRAQ